MIESHDPTTAERAVVCAALRWPKYLPLARGVRPEHFQDLRLGALWATILELDHRESGSADAIMVAHRIDDDGELERRSGGREALAEILTAVPSAAHLEQHSAAVRKDFRRRRLLEIMRRGQNEILSSGHEAESIGRAVEREILEVLGEGANDRFRRIAEVDEVVRAAAEKRTDPNSESDTLETPLWGVNMLLKGGGLNPGDLAVLAGRPGMGKTALAFDFVEAASQKGSAALFSLEMSAESIVERFYARQGGVPSQIGTARGEVARRALDLSTGLQVRMKGMNLWIGDKPGLDISQIRADSLALARRERLRLVAIDYLTLIGAAPGQKYQNREQEVGSISRMSKALAMELRCPVLLLAQLNRGVENRTEKRPTSADLRDSGQIEQDADLILMVYRPSQYGEDGPDEVIVTKNRHFKTGKASVEFDAPAMKWRNMPLGATSDEPRTN